MVDRPTSGHYIADMIYGLIALLLLTGCHSKGDPKIRVGCYPTATWGTTFTDVNDMGLHGYGHQPAEKCGIVYATDAGHIDLTHVRSTADWTKYIAEKAYKHIQSEETYFSFTSNTEPSRYHVHLSYRCGVALPHHHETHTKGRGTARHGIPRHRELCP